MQPPYIKGAVKLSSNAMLLGVMDRLSQKKANARGGISLILANEKQNKKTIITIRKEKRTHNKAILLLGHSLALAIE